MLHVGCTCTLHVYVRVSMCVYTAELPEGCICTLCVYVYVYVCVCVLMCVYMADILVTVAHDPCRVHMHTVGVCVCVYGGMHIANAS
jgi:hypothetical protein